MKFPESFTQLISKTKDTTEYYFSLILSRDGASVAVWSIGANNDLLIASVSYGEIHDDTWDERVRVVDQLLSQAEDKARSSFPISKTVFGLPAAYLTAEGDISNDIRLHLKKLSKLLELNPVGFVPLTQAIAFSLKKNEGIPASVILVNCTKETITVSLYRVGVCVREQTRDVNESVALSLEEFLTDDKDGDVLPSRILLYGFNTEILSHVRGTLLKHQWTSRANFLHFPKIEIIEHEDLLRAVSLSGSSELTSSIGEDKEIADSNESSTVVAQPEENISEEVEKNDEPVQSMHVSSEDDEDVENVEVVGAQALGFGAEDVVDTHPKIRFASTIRSSLLSFMEYVKRIRFPRFEKSIQGAGGIIGVILLFGLLYYFIPRATVTVLVLPTQQSETAIITVDPNATIVDSNTKIIPGQTQELSLSSKKTIPVTGKKNVGDPAKGTVTFYNKITSERILKKGTIITAKGISFSLDEEVKIASATSVLNIDGETKTFSKKEGLVTAVDIGSEGNVSAGSEFAIKDISSSSVLGRNEQAFTGGVSREVTVVSRADYDGAVKTLTDEIVRKAKEQLLSEVGGNRLIEQTIKTKVIEKQFDKELDQEAKEFSGSLTASVSGIVIRDEDVRSLLVALITPKVPAGYTLESGKTDVSIGAVQVKKDGKITVSATVSAVALPIISKEGLQKTLAGKAVPDALEYLKSIVGVAGAEFRIVLSPTNKRLPINKANITISLAVQ